MKMLLLIMLVRGYSVSLNSDCESSCVSVSPLSLPLSRLSQLTWPKKANALGFLAPTCGLPDLLVLLARTSRARDRLRDLPCLGVRPPYPPSESGARLPCRP